MFKDTHSSLQALVGSIRHIQHLKAFTAILTSQRSTRVAMLAG